MGAPGNRQPRGAYNQEGPGFYYSLRIVCYTLLVSVTFVVSGCTYVSADGCELPSDPPWETATCRGSLKEATICERRRTPRAARRTGRFNSEEGPGRPWLISVLLSVLEMSHHLKLASDRGAPS